MPALLPPLPDNEKGNVLAAASRFQVGTKTRMNGISVLSALGVTSMVKICTLPATVLAKTQLAKKNTTSLGACTKVQMISLEMGVWHTGALGGL